MPRRTWWLLEEQSPWLTCVDPSLKTLQAPHEFCDCPNLTEKETEAQRSRTTHKSFQNFKEAGSGFEPMKPGFISLPLYQIDRGLWHTPGQSVVPQPASVLCGPTLQVDSLAVKSWLLHTVYNASLLHSTSDDQEPLASL